MGNVIKNDAAEQKFFERRLAILESMFANDRNIF